MSVFKLSKRATEIGMSGTLAVDERYRELKAKGRDVISLGAGQPDFESPPAARRAGVAAIEQGLTRYTAVAGTATLRTAIARKLKEQNGLAVTPEQIVVGNGAKQVLYHALLALCDPDDEVLIPLPAWPSYAEMVRLVGARPRTIRTEAATGYKLTAEGLMGALEVSPAHPCLLVLNNPSNPTGAVYSRDELLRLVEVIRGENLVVIMDEIYEHIVFDGEFVSFATLPGMRQRTVTVNGVSKCFSMTGWRIGYATGPAPVVQAMRAIASHASGNASSISQCAAEAAITALLESEEGREPLERMRWAFCRRRDLVCRLLDEVPRVRYARPAGTFYVFVDVSDHYGRVLEGRAIAGSRELSLHLLEAAGVAVVPGADFGDDRCVRLSFAASAEDLTVAIKRIAKALGG